jgi:putative transposase
MSEPPRATPSRVESSQYEVVYSLRLCGLTLNQHPSLRQLSNREEAVGRLRRREGQMQRFKSPRQAQRLLSAHAFIYGHFRPRRHLLTARSYRMMRSLAFAVWQEETYARNAT